MISSKIGDTTSTVVVIGAGEQSQHQQLNQQSHLDEDDLRNLRSSFFGLIKYYAQKDVKIGELNSILSFLATTRNAQFQNDLLDVLINLLEAPNSTDQLYLLLFEPNMADGLWSLIAQVGELSETTEKRLFKLFRVLLKTKKVNSLIFFSYFISIIMINICWNIFSWCLSFI